jgi:hypothetical protein
MSSSGFSILRTVPLDIERGHLNKTAHANMTNEHKATYFHFGDAAMTSERRLARDASYSRSKTLSVEHFQARQPEPHSRHSATRSIALSAPTLNRAL